MKAGPADIPQVISAATTYTDTSFEGKDALHGGTNDSRYTTSKNSWDPKIDDGTYFWRRWETQTPSANVLNAQNNPTYHEPRQGGLGNCYIIASAAGVAEFPDLIKETILTESKNNAGVYGFKLYVRGIPWVVSIDDKLLYRNSGSP